MCTLLLLLLLMMMMMLSCHLLANGHSHIPRPDV
jgi:hypothetical protein